MIGKHPCNLFEPVRFLPMNQGGIALTRTSHWLSRRRLQIIFMYNTATSEAVNSCVPNSHSLRKPAPL